MNGRLGARFYLIFAAKLFTVMQSRMHRSLTAPENMQKNTVCLAHCVTTIGLLCYHLSVSACLDAQALNVLADKEMQYMLQRIPPAFADAVADKLIQGQMTTQTPASCQAHWRLSVPAADVAEAQALLQAEPAKQIMLAAQGYQIPEQPILDADFVVDVASLQVKHQETLQTAPLGKLRASVELMYAMLTQARANGQSDAQPWTGADKQVLTADCQQSLNVKAPAACQCYVDGLAEKYTARQVRYNRYLSSNPYAFATGNGAEFKQLDKKLQADCGLTSPH